MWIGVGLSTTFWEIRSVMLILQLENLRNFLLSKDSIVVLTRISVGYYCYICSQAFSGPSSWDVA